MTTHALYIDAAGCWQQTFEQVAFVCQRCNLPMPTHIDADSNTLPAVLARQDTLDFCIAFIGPHTRKPLETAKKLSHVIDDLYFIFLVNDTGKSLQHRLQSPVSTLGHHWEIVDPTGAQFADTLSRSLSAAIKKRKFRTTLSQLNRKLQHNTKPRVSPLQRASVSLEYLSHIVEHAHDGIIATAVDGVIVKWNLAASALLGMTSDQVTGLSIFSILDPQWGQQLRPLYTELSASANNHSEHEIVLNTANHQQQVLAITLSRILDNNKQAIGIAIFMRNITERKVTEQVLEELRKDLERMSFEDGLTGVANRRMFDKQLEQEWRRMQRSRHPLSIVLIDIDYFKHYNDFYGHQAGDDCLRQVASALRQQASRSSDLVARYGGEEFVILLPETNADEAYALALHCAKAVRALTIAHQRSVASEHVTISGGVATLVPDSSNTPQQLLHDADKQLYQAKQKGRDQIRRA